MAVMDLSEAEMQEAKAELEAKRASLAAESLEAAWAAARTAALDASVEKEINPSKENVAAHARAQAAWEKAGDALANRADEVRHLDDTIERLHNAIMTRINGRVTERVETAQAAIRAKVMQSGPALAEMVADVLFLASLSGGRPWPENVHQQLAKHAGLDLQSLCMKAVAHTNAVRAGKAA